MIVLLMLMSESTHPVNLTGSESKKGSGGSDT